MNKVYKKRPEKPLSTQGIEFLNAPFIRRRVRFVEVLAADRGTADFQFQQFADRLNNVHVNRPQNSRATQEVPGKETLELVKFVVPHIQTALHLRRRFVDLTARNCSMESALDLMEYGIILLNDRGCVLQTNYSAEALLRTSDGLRLQDGHIECASRAESDLLHSLIERSVKAGNGRTLKAGGSILVSRRTRRPLSVTAVPLRQSSSPPFLKATAVLFLYDPESQPTPPLDLLRQAYGLTPAEARLALILTQGHSLKEAAHLCGVTHNTAKSQLKSIFIKTNVQRQAQLVRLILSVPLLRQISYK